MHTSTRLKAADFQFCHSVPQRVHPLVFADFCPDYHELDRVGVVSLRLEDGVLQASHALLALTTAFYDCLRAGGSDFFDYPQHFAFVGVDDDGVYTQAGTLPPETPKLWNAWSWLDVWPANKWVTAPPSAAGMLQCVFDYQINRLFWPRALQPTANEPQLPDYAWKMLRTRLKSVYYYDSDPRAQERQEARDLEIHLTETAATLVQESWAMLPGADQAQPQPVAPQLYETVAVEMFMARMRGCFS